VPGISIDFAVALWAVVLLALAGFIGALWFYRTTVPPVSRSRRAILLGVRMLFLGLLLLLLCEPVLHVRFTHTSPPVLAILVDNSKSMSISDHEGSRPEEISSLMANPAFGDISRHATLQFYTFGARFRSWENSQRDTLTFSEGVTDIAGALHGLKLENEQHPINAALLLSDGVFTKGRDPANEAEQLGIPLIVVGIGDSSEQKDLVLSSVVANDLVYAETETPVSATVKSSGFNHERVEVTLAEGTTVLDRTSLLLQPGTQEYSIGLNYVPKGEGIKRFTVGVSSLEGELTTRNNRRTFTTRILRNKLNILVLAGEPSPDIPVIRQTLIEDRNFSVRSFTADNHGGFYEGSLSRTLIDSADCIVMAGFPTGIVSPQLLEQLSHRFTDDHCPLLFLLGKSVNYQRSQPFANILPFTVAAQSQTEQLISFVPAADQLDHPIFNSGEQPVAWTSLPPLYRTVGVYTAKPGGIVLATAKAGNPYPHDPLLVIRSSGNERSAALLGYGVGRWRLMMQGSSQTASILSSFLVNTIQWLTTPDERRPLRVTPVDESISLGEPMDFAGLVANQNAQPVDNAEVTITTRQHDMTYEGILRPLGGGRYEGSLEGLPEGDYVYQAVAMLNGTSLGEDRGRFSVGELDLEFQDTRMNSTLLRQLAFRSGGVYLPRQEIGRLDSLLSLQRSFTQRTIAHTSNNELWHWQWLLGGMIALLAVEWAMRKFSGMV
jgi:hypothetical protein